MCLLTFSLQNSGFPMCLLTFHLFFSLGASLASYGTIWEPFGGVLGNLLEPVGTLGGLLWSYLAPFGPLWGPLDEIWEPLGAPGGPFGVRLGCVWCLLVVKLREWPRSAKRWCQGVIFELFGVCF